MREIKFRAWDKLANQYRDANTVHLSSSGKCFILRADGFSQCTVEFIKDIKVEFFTGLKDKNGKEIYEGDIVKRFSTGDDDGWQKGKVMYRGTVEYITKSCAFVVMSGFDFILSDSQDIEIIGNIYKNPELLKD